VPRVHTLPWSTTEEVGEDVLGAPYVAGNCPEEDIGLSLLQVTARVAKAESKHRSFSRGPESSGWFGSFSQDESTYTLDGINAYRSDPEWAVEFGKDPSVENPFPNKDVLDPVFFHESRSGGPSSAWQTHFPAPNPNLPEMDGQADNRWRYTPSGWTQEYNADPNPLYTGADPATWFDNSVNQFDGFGRPMQPPPYSGSRYDDWEQRSVNTTISCSSAGCVGRSSLQLFDSSVEEAKLCKISIDVHATDYADTNREFVEYWKVNGYIATRKCTPGITGCSNASALAPLYPCVNSLPVADLNSSSGTIVIEGKNSDAVDDCTTSKGDLLSAVALGTCLVRKKPVPLHSTTTTSTANSVSFVSNAVLKCAEPGCTAHALLEFSPEIALNGGRCFMSLNVTQTDYDGAKEQIDLIAVEGVPVATSPIAPGRNPCKDRLKQEHKRVASEDWIYSAIRDYDVTDLVLQSDRKGILRVKGKISDAVDECAYDGHFFHSTVGLHCIP